MAIFAIAVPVLANKTPQLQIPIGQLPGAKKADFAASRKKLGVRERSLLQHTPHGDFIIVTLEGNDPAGAFVKFGQFAAKNRERTLESPLPRFNVPETGGSMRGHQPELSPRVVIAERKTIDQFFA